MKLLSGFVRSYLPQASEIDSEREAELFLERMERELGERRWPFGHAAARWRHFVEIYENLTGDEQSLSAVFLGREFARAYAAISGETACAAQSRHASMVQARPSHGVERKANHACPCRCSPASAVCVRDACTSANPSKGAGVLCLNGR